MGPDDLELASNCTRHLQAAEEAALFRIATLGFRGEALPSIAPSRASR